MPSKDHWLAISQEWEQSDVNQKQFCQDKVINYDQFCFHRAKLLKAGLANPHRHIEKNCKVKTSRDPLTFIPIQTASRDLLSNNVIEVLLPHGISIRIPAHVSSK